MRHVGGEIEVAIVACYTVRLQHIRVIRVVFMAGG